jgi:hypothetical protein
MSRRYWKKKSDTTSSIFELIYFINRRRISGQDIKKVTIQVLNQLKISTKFSNFLKNKGKMG